MQLNQLLACQRRTEISISFSDQIENGGANILAMTPVAWLLAFLRDEPGCAIGLLCLQQPVHLASAEAEHTGGLDYTQATIMNLLNNFKAMQFFLRHGDQKGHGNSERS
ncbi:hypothetical protein QBD00_002504 [Ochrobactrum sp. AN78]|nr:hypothetical protein [Ochrobactrum sp. AN78]